VGVRPNTPPDRLAAVHQQAPVKSSNERSETRRRPLPPGTRRGGPIVHLNPFSKP